MDLGATVCTPRSPSSAPAVRGATPALPAPRVTSRRICRAGSQRIQIEPARPTRYGTAFWCLDGSPEGGVLLRRRPASGLLGGMVEVPTSDSGPATPSASSAGRMSCSRPRFPAPPTPIRPCRATGWNWRARCVTPCTSDPLPASGTPGPDRATPRPSPGSRAVFLAPGGALPGPSAPPGRADARRGRPAVRDAQGRADEPWPPGPDGQDSSVSGTGARTSRSRRERRSRRSPSSAAG